MGIQELICKELNFPHISLSAAEQAGLQGQNGSGSSNPGVQTNQNPGSGITGNNNAFADGAQVNSMFYYRDMQRRLVEFVKKRVLLLEKALNYEYAEDYYVCCVYLQCWYLFTCLVLNCLTLIESLVPGTWWLIIYAY